MLSIQPHGSKGHLIFLPSPHYVQWGMRQTLAGADLITVYHYRHSPWWQRGWSQATADATKQTSERVAFHSAGKQCHLLIVVRKATMQQRPKFKDNFWAHGHLKNIHQFLRNHNWGSLILGPLLWTQIWGKYIEITFVSSNGAKEKSCIWQNVNESPVNLF